MDEKASKEAGNRELHQRTKRGLHSLKYRPAEQLVIVL